jgi:hypothetical protein
MASYVLCDAFGFEVSLDHGLRLSHGALLQSKETSAGPGGERPGAARSREATRACQTVTEVGESRPTEGGAGAYERLLAGELAGRESEHAEEIPQKKREHAAPAQP